MKSTWVRWFTILTLLAGTILPALLAPSPVQAAPSAAKGVPGSAEFAYGAVLDPHGLLVPQAVETAARIGLDWVQVEFNWAALWPDSAQSPNLAALDAAILAAGQSQIPVLLSLRNAPAWAQTPAGPDPTLTSWLVVTLVQRYPQAVQAVELFPGANLTAEWGSAPNPAGYAALFQAVQGALIQAGLPTLLVSAGLTPLDPARPGDGMDDLAFLQGLYQAGGRDWMPVFSMRLPHLVGTPDQSPDGTEHRLLRHYEEVRQVMLANQHTAGLLWITHFRGPGGTIETLDPSALAKDQTAWLIQAYRQMRSQLYIGAVFFHQLNPGDPMRTTPQGDSISLLCADQTQHPFTAVMQKLIAQNNHAFEEPSLLNSLQVKNIVKQRSE